MPGAFLLSDIAAFFDTTDFADSATFDGDTTPVIGIFDRNFDLTQLGGTGVATAAPVFALTTSSVPANARGRYLRFGDIIAGGTRYSVANVHDDGTGITLLQLHEA